MAKSKARRRSVRRYFTKAAHRAKKMTLPLAVMAGLMPGATAVVTTAQSAGWMNAARTASLIYSGYDYTNGKWSLSNMRLGFMPLAVGVIVHKIAGMLGVNRAIAGAGIPFIRV